MKEYHVQKFSAYNIEAQEKYLNRLNDEGYELCSTLTANGGQTVVFIMRLKA